MDFADVTSRPVLYRAELDEAIDSGEREALVSRWSRTWRSLAWATCTSLWSTASGPIRLENSHADRSARQRSASRRRRPRAVAGPPGRQRYGGASSRASTAPSRQVARADPEEEHRVSPRARAAATTPCRPAPARRAASSLPRRRLLHMIGSSPATTVETVMTFGRSRAAAPSITASRSADRVSAPSAAGAARPLRGRSPSRRPSAPPCRTAR